MINLGFQGKFIGEILAKKLAQENETVIVHHVTNHTDHVQVELERRANKMVKFERILMGRHSNKVVSSYIHFYEKPEVVEAKHKAVWKAGNEILTTLVSKNQSLFEQMIKENKKMEFIGWE